MPASPALGHLHGPFPIPVLSKIQESLILTWLNMI